MTNNDNEAADEFVRAVGRESIPLYVVIPGDPEKPVILLPQVITGSTILSALEKAKS